MVLRMKNFNNGGFTEKSDFLGSGFTKNQYRGGGGYYLKRGLGQFPDLQGGLARKRGLLFLRGGGGLIPLWTLCICSLCQFVMGNYLL